MIYEMGDKIKKTKTQEKATDEFLSNGYVEIPELYTPLVFRSKIGCIYFKRNRIYIICDRKGNVTVWDDDIDHKRVLEDDKDLRENTIENIKLEIGQKSTCCEMGNAYIKYSKSNINYGPESDGWAFDRSTNAVSINFCPFCGTKLYNK